jgi:hypothetical protein
MDKDSSGSGSGRISAGFGSCGFGFGDDFSPTVFRFGIEFGFGFGFPPVDIQWISEINYLELKLMFYNMLIITCLLSVGVRTREGPKPTSEICAVCSLIRMVMQREYTKFYPSSGKEGPTSSGGRSFVFPYT